MPHFKRFIKTKEFTYFLLSLFTLSLVFTGVLLYQEKINLSDTLKAVGAELSILIPIIYNIIKNNKTNKNDKEE